TGSGTNKPTYLMAFSLRLPLLNLTFCDLFTGGCLILPAWLTQSLPKIPPSPIWSQHHAPSREICTPYLLCSICPRRMGTGIASDSRSERSGMGVQCFQGQRADGPSWI